MAYAYEDTHMGKEQDTNDLPKDSPPDGTTKVAGDVIDISDQMRNIQQSNAITRSLDRPNQLRKPKADVIKIR